MIELDKNIFQPESEMHLPNDIYEDNPYSYFVNFDRLPKEIPKHLKQTLYRPEKMGRLKKAYHRLAIKLRNDW